MFVQALNTKLKNMSSVMNISSLDGTSFLHSNGRIAKTPKSMNNDDRTYDMMYTRMACNLDTSLSDSCIQ